MHVDAADVALDVQKDAVHDFFGSAPLVPSDAPRENVMRSVVQLVGAIEMA